MFWNGSEWIDARNAVAPGRPKSRRRLRDILATIPILLLVPALLVPLLSVGAGSLSATLTVSSTAVAGETLTVKGAGFSARDWIQLRWDAASTGTTVRVGSSNSFTGQISVPADAASGTHKVSAYDTSKNGKYGVTGTSTPLAVVSVEVGTGTPTPVPTPVATPVATATPAPTASPTPAPTATPSPTQAPVGASIVSVSATSITASQATITWTVSNVATGQVEYGRTTAYGTFSTPELSFLWSTHIQGLSGLTAATTYHYRVRSTTASGTVLISGDYIFTTAGTTVSPTPTPAPTPIATPAPTPTPAPSGTRPFASPVTTRTVNVPSTIDASGSTDVTSALASFVNSVPNGSVIAFPSNGVYRVTQGIYLRGRNNLVFEGNGSTIRSYGPGDSTASSGFKLDNLNTDIAIRNFTIVGSNPNTTTVFNKGTEYQMGVIIFDGARIELANTLVRNVYGDGVFIAGKQSSPYRSSDQVWVHDNTFDYIGRMGFVVNAATNSIAERNYYNHVGLFIFDIESDYDFEVVDNVIFRNNTVGSYGLTPVYTNWFFACSGNQDVAIVRNVYVTGNNVTTGAPINSPNNSTAKPGLASVVGRGNRLSNIRFTGNTTSKTGSGPALYFSRIDGLTITDNVQPVVSGSIASISDSTGVVYQP